MKTDSRLQTWLSNHVPSQTGKRAIVTGATSGIGWETARLMAQTGADVVLATRDERKGREAVRRILQETRYARVRSSQLDLSSQASVKEFAQRESNDPLDILINNAGAMAPIKRRITADGFELTLGTNDFGPFALTGLLLPALNRAQASRIVTVAIAAASQGKFDLNDLTFEKKYALNAAYARSKLAGLIFAVELQRRIATPRLNVTSIASHPGYAITNLQSGELSLGIRLLATVLKPIASHNATHGALPSLYAATSPDVVPGHYYGPDGILQAKGFPIDVPIPPRALNASVARRLWSLSEELTGITYFGTR